MSELCVFKNKEALLHDYTPSHLPHREREMRRLEHYFNPVLYGEDGMSVRVHVHGQIGTGKLASFSILHFFYWFQVVIGNLLQPFAS